jgi:hypothetical protein
MYVKKRTITVMEELYEDDSDYEVKIFSLRGLSRVLKNLPNMLRYSLDYVPLYDRPAPLSLTPSANGPIATLSRIELNERRGRPLDEGLSSPDQLNQPGALSH